MTFWLETNKWRNASVDPVGRENGRVAKKEKSQAQAAERHHEDPQWELALTNIFIDEHSSRWPLRTRTRTWIWTQARSRGEDAYATSLQWQTSICEVQPGETYPKAPTTKTVKPKAKPPLVKAKAKAPSQKHQRARRWKRLRVVTEARKFCLKDGSPGRRGMKTKLHSTSQDGSHEVMCRLRVYFSSKATRLSCNSWAIKYHLQLLLLEVVWQSNFSRPCSDALTCGNVDGNVSVILANDCDGSSLRVFIFNHSYHGHGRGLFSWESNQPPEKRTLSFTMIKHGMKSICFRIWFVCLILAGIVTRELRQWSAAFGLPCHLECVIPLSAKLNSISRLIESSNPFPLHTWLGNLLNGHSSCA